MYDNFAVAKFSFIFHSQTDCHNHIGIFNAECGVRNEFLTHSFSLFPLVCLFLSDIRFMFEIHSVEKRTQL